MTTVKRLNIIEALNTQIRNTFEEGDIIIGIIENYDFICKDKPVKKYIPDVYKLAVYIVGKHKISYDEIDLIPIAFDCIGNIKSYTSAKMKKHLKDTYNLDDDDIQLIIDEIKELKNN